MQVDRYPDGGRRITEVAAVASQRREVFRLSPVAAFESAPIGTDRKVEGEFRHYRLPEVVARRLAFGGVPVPPEFGAGAQAPERVVA